MPGAGRHHDRAAAGAAATPATAGRARRRAGARAAGSRLEVVHVDAGGEVRVLHTLARARGAPSLADLAVDRDSGRFGLLVEADTVDGVATGTPRDVMTLVLGTVAGESVAIGPGDRTCVMHRCFEAAIAIAPGGDAVVTTLRRSSASDLARYTFGPSPAPTKLTSAAAERPVMSPDHARFAYVRRQALHVVEVGAETAGEPIATGVRDVAAVADPDLPSPTHAPAQRASSSAPYGDNSAWRAGAGGRCRARTPPGINDCERSSQRPPVSSVGDSFAAWPRLHFRLGSRSSRRCSCALVSCCWNGVPRAHAVSVGGGGDLQAGSVSSDRVAASKLLDWARALDPRGVSGSVGASG